MRLKIYIETSVISYYTSRSNRDIVIAARQQITQEWWEESRHQFDLFISMLVLEEAKGGDSVTSKRRIEALNGIPVLEISDEAEELASSLVKLGPIPESHSEDALHIALATVNGMDFLLTWNFNHINNAAMKKGITRIVEKQCFEVPIICSPEELEGE